jgi:hypothetical protein
MFFSHDYGRTYFVTKFLNLGADEIVTGQKRLKIVNINFFRKNNFHGFFSVKLVAEIYENYRLSIISLLRSLRSVDLIICGQLTHFKIKDQSYFFAYI